MGTSESEDYDMGLCEIDVLRGMENVEELLKMEFAIVGT
jgi:hypothetical protein